MNRGRRRGGGTGLLGLREGVKRRLFDPYAVPTKPDVKYEVNRLPPLTGAINVTYPTVFSRLEELQQSKRSTKLANLADADKPVKQPHILTSKAMVEFAFRHSPFYHTLPVRPEGIQLNAVTPAGHADKTDLSDSVSLPHLFLLHKEISLWKDGNILRGLEDPVEWYPAELVELSKVSGVAKKPTSTRKRRKTMAPVSELISESALAPPPAEANVEYLETEQEGMEDPTEMEKANESEDSDDARWNGEVTAEGDPNDIDEEELENDYCQTYFDNGEGDLSDDLGAGVGGGGDDDEGGRYYD